MTVLQALDQLPCVVCSTPTSRRMQRHSRSPIVACHQRCERRLA